MAYGIGGGGGRAPGFTENPRFSLSKPADLTDLTDPGQVNQLDEMLRELYASNRLMYQVLVDGGVIGSDGAAAGGGDVIGPSGAVDSRLAAFDGVTGKLIRDSGYTASTLIAAAGTVFLAEADVSEAELETSGNPKKIIIPAAGAGIVIVPLQLQVFFNLTVNYTNAPTMHLEYVGNVTDITGAIASLASAGAPETTVGGTGSASWELSSGTFDPRNVAVGFCTNTNFTGAGSATAKVKVWYTLANFN